MVGVGGYRTGVRTTPGVEGGVTMTRKEYRKR